MYLWLISYDTDSSFLDRFVPNLVQGSILGANSKSEAILWIGLEGDIILKLAKICNFH